MHDLATIREMNRREIAKQWKPSGTQPSGSTPTTANDAIIASQVRGRRESYAHPPLFRYTLMHTAEGEPHWLARRLSMRDAWGVHTARRRETFSEFTNVRWYELDRHSDEL